MYELFISSSILMLILRSLLSPPPPVGSGICGGAGGPCGGFPWSAICIGVSPILAGGRVRFTMRDRCPQAFAAAGFEAGGRGCSDAYRPALLCLPLLAGFLWQELHFRERAAQVRRPVALFAPDREWG